MVRSNLRYEIRNNQAPTDMYYCNMVLKLDTQTSDIANISKQYDKRNL